MQKIFGCALAAAIISITAMPAMADWRSDYGYHHRHRGGPGSDFSYHRRVARDFRYHHPRQWDYTYHHHHNRMM